MDQDHAPLQQHDEATAALTRATPVAGAHIAPACSMRSGRMTVIQEELSRAECLKGNLRIARPEIGKGGFSPALFDVHQQRGNHRKK